METPVRKKRLQISVYDLFILMITGLSIFSLLVITLPFFDAQAKQIAFTLDTLLSILFLLDFFFIFGNAENKRAFLKWGWVDFLGSLPYMPLFRILRIFRAIRSLRILRQNGFRDIWRIVRSRPERTTIFSFLLISILLISISSYTILRIEQNSPGSNITNVGEAYWWTLVTITTVGYGDYYPVTNNGRIVALILMLTGIGLFSAFTSYLSSSFVNRRNRKLKRGNDKIAIRLAAIEDQLRELTEEIRNNPPDSKKDDS